MVQHVVVRTDKRASKFILAELHQGRLRQGWGWLPEQDLLLIRAKSSSGAPLSPAEVAAWRSHRLLDLKTGDVLVLPNVTRQGFWVLARVAGPYDYILADGQSDYRHVVPVTLVTRADGTLAEVKADNEHVHARLRASMRSMSRMWSVEWLAEHIESVLRAVASGADTVTPHAHVAKLARLGDDVFATAWRAIWSQYRGAELEHLVVWVFEREFANARVEHRGGRGEHGADLLVVTEGGERIAVQVKLHEGEDDDVHSLHQIARAREKLGVDRGIVVTTATRVTQRFEKECERVKKTAGIDIDVMTRAEFVALLLKHLGSERAPAVEADE